MSDDIQIYFRPSAYNIEGLSFDHRYARIERRDPEQDVWAIIDGGYCLNTTGEWEYEPSPSNRDIAFLARTRFPLLEAMKFVERTYGEMSGRNMAKVSDEV